MPPNRIPKQTVNGAAVIVVYVKADGMAAGLGAGWIEDKEECACGTPFCFL